VERRGTGAKKKGGEGTGFHPSLDEGWKILKMKEKGWPISHESRASRILGRPGEKGKKRNAKINWGGNPKDLHQLMVERW